MIPDWRAMIHPLELYGVLALTATCLLHTLVLHLKLRAIGKHTRELESRLAGSVEALDRLKSQAETAGRASGPRLGPAINLNSRGQALRMRRRGETPETIAGALSLPRNEVDLLLKVHQLAVEQITHSGAGPRVA